MQEHKSFLIKDLLSDVLPVPQEGKNNYKIFLSHLNFKTFKTKISFKKKGFLIQFLPKNG